MKVLIVDDESLILRSLRRAFEVYSHEVAEASDGQLGMAEWRRFDPDIVILDVLMPGLTGPQVLREMGKNRRAKVVLISAYSGEYDLKKVREMGANLFVPKPFSDIFDFVKTVENLYNDKVE